MRGMEPTGWGRSAITRHPCLGVHSAEDPHHLASPPSGEPETGSGRADRVGSDRTVGKNRHTSPGRRAQARAELGPRHLSKDPEP